MTITRWGEFGFVGMRHSRSQYIITPHSCAVTVLETQQIFMVSSVYVYNIEIDMQHLWNDIKATKNAYGHLAVPSVMLGDFNEILSTSKYSRYMDYTINQVGMRHFQEVVSDCNLMDMASSWALFTW